MISFNIVRWILRRLGCPQACLKREASLAFAGQHYIHIHYHPWLSTYSGEHQCVSISLGRHVDWDGLITVSTTVQQEGLRSLDCKYFSRFVFLKQPSKSKPMVRVISTVLEAKFGGSEASPTDLQG